MRTRIITAKKALQFKQEMLDLYATYYEVEEEKFFTRFESNNYYALYMDGDRIVGFTGIRLKDVALSTRTVQTIYLGQTVLCADFRGRSRLPRTCTLLIARAFVKNPLRPIFVWCDSLTYKPYLLFANSLQEFYPSRHQPTEGEAKELMDHLGAYYYGDSYDSETGTVYKAQNVISDFTAIITPEKRQHPDIQFFVEANPNHFLGHGLLTLTPMHWKNFAFLVKKCIRKALQPKTLQAQSATNTRVRKSNFAL